ncbi:acyltransferase family protein [Porphyrobacter sp. ULC335]|uniref:acyltransferase family protein n=1 Tax=Porphyrobacter sp. ULC335 TaxID=2854260 RepID=UPI0022209B62|nr:acyltransferase family protein [Porphyrobacter sp. ULC335]UYV15051.1 acyltransferase [Porphyrobacter sp. ULC335]
MTASARPGPLAIGHRPEIDGLRSLAIAPVVLHHTAPALLPGGFAGVDVFFVISGYLITAIILGEHAAGRFSLRAFWERRVRRIVPALAVMLWITMLCGWAIMTPEDFHQFAKALFAASVFASNIHFAGGVGYFGGVEGSLPLIHTWTLGVEEQFYLAFPLLLLAMWRWRDGKLMLPMMVLLGLASFALALWLAPRMPEAAFYSLPTRLWELMLGAVCAALPRTPRADGRLAALGIGLIIAAFVLIVPETPAPGPMFLLPTIGAALVLLFAGRETMAGQVLAFRPLTWLGLISFGVYLWHQPVLAFAHYMHFGPLPPVVMALCVSASIGLGWLSWRFIEEPVRRRQRLAHPGALLAVCAAALAVPLAVGAAGYTRTLLPHTAAEAQRVGGIIPDGAALRVAIPSEGSLGFVLYGDSHAVQYYAAAQARFGPGAVISEPSCLAAEGASNWPGTDGKGEVCNALKDTLLETVNARKVGTVIWAQRWERELFDSATDESLGNTEAKANPALLAAITRTIDRLPPGTRVILMGNSPTAWPAGPDMERGWLRCRAMRNATCRDSFPLAKAEGRKVSATLRALAARDPRITYIDPADTLCPGGRCLVMQDGQLNYWDHNHMTRRAAARVMGQIDTPLTLP